MVQGPSGPCLKYAHFWASPFGLGSGRAPASVCEQIPRDPSCMEFENCGRTSEVKWLVPNSLHLSAPGRACVAGLGALGGPLLLGLWAFILLLSILSPGPQASCDAGEALGLQRTGETASPTFQDEGQGLGPGQPQEKSRVVQAQLHCCAPSSSPSSSSSASITSVLILLVSLIREGSLWNRELYFMVL